MMRRRTMILVGVLLVIVGVVVVVVLYLLDKSDTNTPMDIRALSGSALDKFLSNLNRIESDGMYVDVGRIHGDDRYQCPHEKPTFLVWHRAYLSFFERQLGGPMPYWDWTERVHLPIIDDEQFKDRPNPLYQNYMYDSAKGGHQRDVPTTRQWQDVEEDTLSEYVYRALTRPGFADFQRELEAVHALIHNSIGGTMVPVKTSAFDPIFWLHHSFVNVVFAMWVALHPKADLSGFNDLAVEGYDLSGSRTSFRDQYKRNVKIPFNDVYRRAASAVSGGVGFQAMEAAAVPDHNHLLVVLHNVTSPIDSQMIRVTFGDKLAGVMGMIGMVHMDMAGMPRLEYDRVVDVTRSYFDSYNGVGLDQLRQLTQVEFESLVSGKKELYQGPWSLQWEVY